MPTLQDAINELYRIVVLDRKPTSTIRLRALALHCAEELQRRGLVGALPEQKIQGWVRTKDWDVALAMEGRVRLAISLKSMLRNLAGSVPNRTDDLLGEAADVQLRYPEMVLGYVIIMDEGGDSPPGPAGKWIPIFHGRLAQAAQRRAPTWMPGLIEAAVVVRVDFRNGPELRSPPDVLDSFFDELVSQHQARSG